MDRALLLPLPGPAAAAEEIPEEEESLSKRVPNFPAEDLKGMLTFDDLQFFNIFNLHHRIIDDAFRKFCTLCVRLKTIAAAAEFTFASLSSTYRIPVISASFSSSAFCSSSSSFV